MCFILSILTQQELYGDIYIFFYTFCYHKNNPGNNLRKKKKYYLKSFRACIYF